MRTRRNEVFYVFECQHERGDGTLCRWPYRAGEGRVPRGPDGRRAREIEEFCKRCKRQGRAQEGERCLFCLVRRETADRRVIEDIPFAEAS